MEQENAFIPVERVDVMFPYYYDEGLLEARKVETPIECIPEKLNKGSCYFPPDNPFLSVTPPKSKSEAVINPYKIKQVNHRVYKLKITAELREGIDRIAKAFAIVPYSSLRTHVQSVHTTNRRTVLLALEEVICYVILQTEKSPLKYASTALTGEYNKYRVIKRPYLDVFLTVLSKECDIMVRA